MDHEAVRVAEQTVSDAWIGRLLLAEGETAAILGACARVQDRVADRVRAAQRSGDLSALARWQVELELADRACERALKAHEMARTCLAEELATWADAVEHRARQAGRGPSGTGKR